MGLQVRNKYVEGNRKCLALRITGRRIKMLNGWLKSIHREHPTIASYNVTEFRGYLDIAVAEWPTPYETILK